MPANSAEYQRAYRERRKANGGARLTVSAESEKPPEREQDPPAPINPAAAVAGWAAKRLRVPPGHKNAGRPMELPPFATRFLRDALRPGVREAALFCGRKNAKSAVLAVLILAHLADDGPLRRRGWRCGAASLSKDKAVELWQQIVDIAEASGLTEVKSGKVPRHVSSGWGRCEFLSADKTAGHASGFDIAIADEIGLFPASGRALVSGLLSSTSARDGRLIAISVLGDSPLSREMCERSGDPATVVHLYQARKDCELDDESAWEVANPALGTVKSRGYMRDMARRAAANPLEAAEFRVFDLNQPGSPTKTPIVAADRWALVAKPARPARSGRCVLGFDAGGSASMTAAALFWPECGRLECYGAFPDDPGLRARGVADGVGDLYERMEARGELRPLAGAHTPVPEFLAWVDEVLDGAVPVAALADYYRRDEVRDYLARAGVPWQIVWRRTGAGPDGFADVRSFQKAVLSRSLHPGESLILESAIRESHLDYSKDNNGNPYIDRRRRNGRIDALQAALLAVGAGERMMSPAGAAPAPAVYHIPLEDLE